MDMFGSTTETLETLRAGGYIAGEELATSLYLALGMGLPIFLEGEPGVGKTELARVVSTALQTRLIRLQCYEGLDLSQAAYEWNYAAQLLALQGRREGDEAPDLFSREFLLERPLLEAISDRLTQAPVLLIDELDRADDEFESFLLELLSDFQISIPELGTVRARHRPIVMITSNRTREVHDALKRRCLYHWIDYPDYRQEIEILSRKVPELSSMVASQVVHFTQRLRKENLYKHPGVAETLNWALGLLQLGVGQLDAASVENTLGLFLKYHDDVEHIRGDLAGKILDEALAAADAR